MCVCVCVCVCIPFETDSKQILKLAPLFNCTDGLSLTVVTCVIYYHVIGVFLTSQSASEKHNQDKSPQTLAQLVNFSKNVSAMLSCNLVILTIE